MNMTLKFKKGDFVFKQGDPSDCAYLVQKGNLLVFSSDDIHCYELSKLGPGDVFGEMSLVLKSYRSASVVALTDCEAIALEGKHLELHLKETHPAISSLLSVLVERLDATNEFAKNKIYSDPVLAIAWMLDVGTKIQNKFNKNKTGRRMDDLMGLGLSITRIYKDAYKTFLFEKHMVDNVFKYLQNEELINYREHDGLKFISIRQPETFWSNVETLRRLSPNSEFLVNTQKLHDLLDVSSWEGRDPSTAKERLLRGDYDLDSLYIAIQATA